MSYVGTDIVPFKWAGRGPEKFITPGLRGHQTINMLQNNSKLDEYIKEHTKAPKFNFAITIWPPNFNGLTACLNRVPTKVELVV